MGWSFVLIIPVWKWKAVVYPQDVQLERLANPMDPRRYRENVACVFVNQSNQVLIARRAGSTSHPWQFPQGGIELGETPREAVRREMQEELGIPEEVTEMCLEKETVDWISYDFPAEVDSKVTQTYRGQKQKWFLGRLSDDDVGPNLELAETPKEFIEFKWVSVEEALDGYIPWKKGATQRALLEFGLI